MQIIVVVNVEVEGVDGLVLDIFLDVVRLARGAFCALNIKELFIEWRVKERQVACE